MRRTLKLLGRLGKVDEVAHDHFFLRGAVGEMVDVAIDLAAQAPHGQFTAAQFRDRLENGRKVAIQILEFFDRHGVTLRRGDLRRINKHRLDLFLRPSQEQAAPATDQTGGESSPVGRRDFKSGEGPRAGLWWVRLPLSSATIAERRMTQLPFLDDLQAAAHDAEAVASVEAEDAAVAHASAALRARLGWTSDSEARTAVVALCAGGRDSLPCAVIGCGSAGEPG